MHEFVIQRDNELKKNNWGGHYVKYLRVKYFYEYVFVRISKYMKIPLPFSDITCSEPIYDIYRFSVQYLFNIGIFTADYKIAKQMNRRNLIIIISYTFKIAISLFLSVI